MFGFNPMTHFWGKFVFPGVPKSAIKQHLAEITVICIGNHMARNGKQALLALNGESIKIDECWEMWRSWRQNYPQIAMSLPKLETLRICSTGARYVKLGPLLGLAQHRTLHTLEFIAMTNLDIAALCQALAAFGPKLRGLTLQDCTLDYNKLCQILAVLQQYCPALESLDLSENPFLFRALDDCMITAPYPAPVYFPCLQKLNLCNTQWETLAHSWCPIALQTVRRLEMSDHYHGYKLRSGELSTLLCSLSVTELCVTFYHFVSLLELIPCLLEHRQLRTLDVKMLDHRPAGALARLFEAFIGYTNLETVRICANNNCTTSMIPSFNA